MRIFDLIKPPSVGRIGDNQMVQELDSLNFKFQLLQQVYVVKHYLKAWEHLQTVLLFIYF
jgi:hypothetical protein